MAEKMHADELEMTVDQVRQLIAEQFPCWAHLPLRPVEPTGTVNAVFRLGTGLSVRLARRNGPTKPGGKEFTWLPRVAPHVPLDIPIPVAEGGPGRDYPWFWEIHTWVEGQTVPIAAIDPIQAAQDLAKFVAAMQRLSPDGGPPGRGMAPLAQRDEDFRYGYARFNGDSRVAAVWDRALAATPWHGSPVWHHGDLDVRNWLVRDGRITGIIDWGEMGIGDPACDVMVAWKLHSVAARDEFRHALPTDDATWARARGWVVLQAVAILAYYTPASNPWLYHEAQSWIDVVLSEDNERL